ncbi:hypothetical protein [Pseudoalteromonas ruthenica]|uniref:hypothetical protein n=1 Tax=Pseudoalteromonas ruthenica TaxID=151081 RepID=UPI00110B2961|nr:hypothetical protein [Pseudoalteromonas ruthenica]TMO88820.1 hypothetical protein CWC12_07310 [Pseudoalteromonas ruthenica]TMP23407.1 hypothetical protein CWC06_11160 [Pseudoalteromonas ruthenica]
MRKCRKAKEMHAEQLLKISTNLFTAFIATILVVPISIVIRAALQNTTTQNPFDIFFDLFSSWYGVIFIVAEIALYYIVFKARDNAYSIYNELYPDGEVET